MTRYLVLLRGINVGGRNKVPMAALRDLLESHGHTKVSSYIASGNVILSSDQSAAAIKRELEEALPKTFKLDSELVSVLVLTLAQLRAIVRKRPKGFGDHPATYHSDAVFLMGIDAPTRDAGLRPAARRRRGVAGNRRDLFAATQRAADEEPTRQNRGHARPQVDDDPQLADDAGTPRAYGGAGGRGLKPEGAETLRIGGRQVLLVPTTVTPSTAG